MAKTEIKKKVSFDLEPSLIQELKKLSDLMVLKQSELLREAIQFFLLFASKKIKIIEIKNNELIEKYINIEEIKKIDNENTINDLNIKSKGTLYLKNNNTVKFISIYPITNENIKNYMEIHSNIIEKIKKNNYYELPDFFYDEPMVFELPEEIAMELELEKMKKTNEQN